MSLDARNKYQDDIYCRRRRSEGSEQYANVTKAKQARESLQLVSYNQDGLLWTGQPICRRCAGAVADYSDMSRSDCL